MATEISRTISVGPLLLGLLVYWAVALAYFRWRGRRSVEPAVLRALPGGKYELALDVHLAALTFTLLLPFAVLFLVAILRS
jgi:hypothetical protein